MAGRAPEYAVAAETYLLVDIGGGTVDVASHKIVDNRIVERAPPVGNLWGGTTVNEEFSKFLQEFVDDPEFSRYTKESQNPEDQACHKAELNKLLYATFEKEKKRFGSGKDREYYKVKFPRTFIEEYKNLLVKKGSELKSKGEAYI